MTGARNLQVAVLSANTFTGIQTYNEDLKLKALKKFFLDGGSIVNFNYVDPTVELTVKDDAGSGFKIKNSDGSIHLHNGTSTANSFNAVTHLSSGGSNARRSALLADIPPLEDTGSTPVLVINSRQNDSTPITTRPLLEIQNDGAKKIGVDKDGNMDITVLTASRALISDANKIIKSSSVTDTELGHVSGVTSAIQTQIDTKQADLDLISQAEAEAGSATTERVFSALRVKQAIDALADGVIFTPALSTDFQVSTRYSSQLVGSGTTAFNTFGVDITTSTTISSSARLIYRPMTSTALNTVARWWASIVTSVQGTDYNMYWGVGTITVDASSITYTISQYGFKSIRTASGTVVVSATNANGTTETATDIGITSEAGNYFIDKQSGSSIKFYRQGTGDTVYTLEATHTTNISTSTINFAFSGAVSNVDVASNSQIRVGHSSYQQKVT